MKKVKLEETFLINQTIRCSIRYHSIDPGLYKRLLLIDDTVVWVEFNNGKSDYGGHSNMNFINDSIVVKELEKRYLATTREQQISSVID
jgi:hypothetical protein